MDSRYTQLETNFKTFHAAHPEIWVHFCNFTFDRINKGWSHYSSKAVFERIRWEVAVPELYYSENEFKLNNNYTAFYARKFIEEYPKHKGFFRFREQKSETCPAVAV